jgi:glycosyltransferase involved in cell wall biosynthesis
MAKKILMVSSYPPMHCGIGSYAAQSVTRLRKEGNIVDVLSLPGGGGDFVQDLQGGKKLSCLMDYRQAYDEIIMQYCPYFFFVPYDADGARWSNLQACLTMRKVFKRWGNVTVVCHEEIYRTSEQIGALMAWAERIKWNGVSRIIFHTKKELEKFCSSYGWAQNDPRLILKKPNEDYQKLVDITKSEARQKCCWPSGKIVFLTMGFIQPTKGFDRAIRAFASATRENTRLYIIGSVRYQSAETQEYEAQLRQLASSTPGVVLEVGFISDEMFDTYLVAADYIVLPYREIWSSAVLGRAKLYKKPVIASNVGGMSEQLEAGDFLVDNDEEMALAMTRICDGTLQIHHDSSMIAIRRLDQTVWISTDEIDILHESIHRMENEIE